MYYYYYHHHYYYYYYYYYHHHYYYYNYYYRIATDREFSYPLQGFGVLLPLTTAHCTRKTPISLDISILYSFIPSPAAAYIAVTAKPFQYFLVNTSQPIAISGVLVGAFVFGAWCASS